MGVRDDAIDMVDVLGRADDLSLKFRANVGLGGERAYGMAADTPIARHETQGLLISDVDLLLHRHEDYGFNRGYDQGAREIGDRLRAQHEQEVGQYVAGMCDVASSDMLAHVVTAAVKANESKATKQGIVDAVVAAVKREAAALDDVAARARRGELFS